MSDTVTSETTEETANRIDYDNTKVLNNVYVTAREGLESKQQPNKLAKSVTHFDYGARLEVIEIIGE